MASIFKGDTAENFIEIELENETDLEIYKVIVQCGDIRKRVYRFCDNYWFYSRRGGIVWVTGKAQKEVF